MSKMLNLYDFYYDLYKQGRISKQFWENYCTQCLAELMQENRQVLENLKNM
jgi:hypothetical protein